MHLNDAKVNLFADDSLIFISGNNPLELVLRMNEQLTIVNDWLRFNNMALNVKKCNAMVINDNAHLLPDIKIDNQCITVVNCVKYLGIWIDDKLNFDIHFNKLKSKIQQRVGMLRRISCKLTRRTKEIFLKSLILPYYDYCSSILIMLDDCRLDELQRSINKAMRIVLQVPRDTPIASMLIELRILSVKNRIRFNCLKLINKTIQRGMPLQLNSKFTTRIQNRQRPLRNDGEYELPHWRLKKSRKSLFYEGIRMYNEIMIINTEEPFNVKCRNYLLSLN
jgi:hypothetical protein